MSEALQVNGKGFPWPWELEFAVGEMGVELWKADRGR